MDNVSREQAITRTSVIGILTNIGLTLVKLFAGFVAGSISIMLDALNNLTDAISSIVTIIGIKLAKRPADDKHPFGHGRIEYFSTMIIALIIICAGFSSVIESVKKIIEPVKPEYSLVTIIIIVISVFTKLILGRYVSKMGEKYNSDALVASGKDASFDAIISIATLIGAIILFITHYTVDGIIGALIAVCIIKAGLEMLGEAVSNVMGNRADAEITKAIKAYIKEIPGVLGAYDLVLHDYGPGHRIGAVHVEIPAEMNAEEIHRLTQKIQIAIVEKFGLFLTVGIYAIENKDQVKIDIRQKLTDLCMEKSGVVNVHGVCIELDEFMSFDITIDFTVKDKAKFLEGVKADINKIYPGYKLYINLDTNYSD